MFKRYFQLPLQTRWAILLWIVLIEGILGRVAFSPVTSQTVIPIYESAGQRWNKAESLYAPIIGQDLYRNPPGFAILFAPFTDVHPRAIALGWRILGISVFLYGLYGFTRSARVFLFAAVLILPSFNNGQVNTLLVGSALCGVAAMQRKRWWLASAWLAFMVGLKLYPLALVGLLCLVAPKQLTWRVVLLSCAVLAFPYLLQSSNYITQQYKDFVNLAQADDRSAIYLERAPRDWSILPRIMFDEFVPRDVSLGVSVVAGLLMALAVALSLPRIFTQPKPAPAGPPERHPGGLPENRKLEFALALGLIWMTLFGPATETNTYSLLAPMGLLLVRPQNRWELYVSLVGLILLMLTIIRFAFPQNWGFPLNWAQPTGAILLLGVTLHQYIRPAKCSPPTSGS